MTTKYAGSEIFQIAVELEINGRKFYEELHSDVKDEQLQETFKFLADEELKHEKTFRSMMKTLDKEPDTGIYDDREMILYFNSLVDRSVFPSDKENMSELIDTGSIRDIVERAITFEKNTILFFSEMLNSTRPEDHEVIQKIIEEERSHIHRLLKLL